MKTTTEKLTEALYETAEEIEQAFDDCELMEWIDANALEITTMHEAETGYYTGTEILITNNGPTVWIDTRYGDLIGSYDGMQFPVHLNDKAVETIDEAFDI